MGLGTLVSSIITTLIAKRYEKQKLIFETKLTSYSNLIQTYPEFITTGGDGFHKIYQSFIASKKHVELIGSAEVIKLCQTFQKGQESA